jgi:hypothetical protein
MHENVDPKAGRGVVGKSPSDLHAVQDASAEVTGSEHWELPPVLKDVSQGLSDVG